MNERMYQRAIEISRALKPQIQTGKSAHTTIVYKKSKMVCIATNDYSKPHNERRFGRYENWKGFKTEYRPCTHSEAKAILKLGEENLSDYTFLNIRIDNNGNANMARACPNCMRTLQSFGGGPKKMFYSDGNGELTRDERF
jgi:formylmethanofuran dehydrogenase subunit E